MNGSTLGGTLYKRCGRCEIEKPHADFYKDRNRKDGLTPQCIACRKQSYRDNAPRRIAAMGEWAKKNAERSRQIKRRYAEKFPERVQASRKAWEIANPAAKAEKEARRRAAKLNATPRWNDVDRMREFYFAADFLSMVTGEWYHVDHIVPLQSKLVCGFHADSNLQVVPGAHNQAKGNRWWPDMP